TVEPGTHTSDHGGSSDPETRESRRLWEKPEISGPQRHDETAGLGVLQLFSPCTSLFDIYEQPLAIQLVALVDIQPEG
ncbi:hypothetical protein, partial [Glutamicibacter sp. BSL13]